MAQDLLFEFRPNVVASIDDVLDIFSGKVMIGAGSQRWNLNGACKSDRVSAAPLPRLTIG